MTYSYISTDSKPVNKHKKNFYQSDIFFLPVYYSVGSRSSVKKKKKSVFLTSIYHLVHIITHYRRAVICKPSCKGSWGENSFSYFYLLLWCSHRKSIREQNAVQCLLYIRQVKKKQETVSTIYQGFLKAAMVGWLDSKPQKVVTRDSTQNHSQELHLILTQMPAVQPRQLYHH